jgi:hypothetical protein
MNARIIKSVSGSLIMWVLAVGWWLGSDRSLLVTAGALGIGLAGTAISAWGAGKPEPDRWRAVLAAGVAAVVAFGLLLITRR